MARKGFLFDTANFDTRISLARGRLAQHLFNGSLGSTVLENVRDACVRSTPILSQRLSYLISRNKALALSILEVSGKKMFLDASKSADTMRYLSREKDLALRAVHLVRDVRGFSCSRRKNKGETDLQSIVKRWIRANVNIERQLRRLPLARWTRIRYEDLCADPLETLNRFFEFCRLEPLRSLSENSRSEHHIVPHRMRLSNDGVVRLDESWRHLLTPTEHASISRLAGKTHVHFGYKPISPSDLSLHR
jgi:hypothetical protein